MNTIVHVPHASLRIPSEFRDQFLLTDQDLVQEARESADLYTDIHAQEAWSTAQIICSDISRLVVDVERYPDDTDERMSKYGRGMIYTSTHLGRPLRRNLSEVEKQDLRKRFYDLHWARLRAAAKDGILIDLHSYPKDPWAIEAYPTASRPEIDLGTDEKLTPQDWINSLRSHFENLGFSVGQNTPYAGVIDAGSKFAVMIEIRRDVLCSPEEKAQWQKVSDAWPAPTS